MNIGGLLDDITGAALALVSASFVILLAGACTLITGTMAGYVGIALAWLLA